MNLLAGFLAVGSFAWALVEWFQRKDSDRRRDLAERREVLAIKEKDDRSRELLGAVKAARDERDKARDAGQEAFVAHVEKTNGLLQQLDEATGKLDNLRAQLLSTPLAAPLPEFNSIECPNCRNISVGKLLLLDFMYDIPDSPLLDPKRTGYAVRCPGCETMFCTAEGGGIYRVVTPPEPAKEAAPKAGDNNRKLAGLDGMRGPRGRRG